MSQTNATFKEFKAQKALTFRKIFLHFLQRQNLYFWGLAPSSKYNRAAQGAEFY